MQPHVDLTIGVPAERFSTERAGEGLLARVAPLVDGKTTAVDEGLAAGGAAMAPFVGVLVLACVEAHVSFAVPVATEAPPADFAGEGSLAGVAPHVDD